MAPSTAGWRSAHATATAPVVVSWRSATARKRRTSARCRQAGFLEPRVASPPVVVGQDRDPLTRHRPGQQPDPMGE